jgi:GNAT superfamily N-acetyltransferase
MRLRFVLLVDMSELPFTKVYRAASRLLMSFSRPPRHGAKVPLDARLYSRLDEWKNALLEASAKAAELREPEARQAWLARHHQILTLASPRALGGGGESENLIAWSTSSSPDAPPDQFGVLLPQAQIAVVRFGTRPLPIAEWLEITSAKKFWRGESEIALDEAELDVNQWAWLKELSTSWSRSDSLKPTAQAKPELRRATAADLWSVQEMASSLAQDIRESPLATRAEAMHWLKAGRLFLLTQATAPPRPNCATSASALPIAMGALSGEFRDPISGRTSERLSLLFVRRDLRGQGVGQEMIAQLEVQLRNEAIQDLVLFSDIRHEATNRFYAKLGFQHRGSWSRWSI